MCLLNRRFSASVNIPMSALPESQKYGGDGEGSTPSPICMQRSILQLSEGSPQY
jgi:hypothetical protein